MTPPECPIVKTLSIVGDKWSLVLVRDMIVGKRRFQEFLGSPEGITTNILTARLRKLEAEGLVVKTAYQASPKRYEYSLTPRGLGLLPVLQAISRWGNTHYPGTYVPPAEFMQLTVPEPPEPS